MEYLKRHIQLEKQYRCSPKGFDRSFGHKASRWVYLVDDLFVLGDVNSNLGDAPVIYGKRREICMQC